MASLHCVALGAKIITNTFEHLFQPLFLAGLIIMMTPGVSITMLPIIQMRRTRPQTGSAQGHTAHQWQM